MALSPAFKWTCKSFEGEKQTEEHKEKQLDKGEQRLRKTQQVGQSPSGLDVADIIPLSLSLFFSLGDLNLNHVEITERGVVIHEQGMKLFIYSCTSCTLIP